MQRFQWTPAKEQALALARTGHTQAEIASRLGTTRRTVAGWARRSAWKAKRQALSDASFAEWERQDKADTQRRAAEWAASAASYTKPPRGTRSHRTRWYQQPRTPVAETPSAGPIYSRPQRSAQEILDDMRERQALATLQPRKAWWE